ncbi:thiamine/thiamine pyrophosphate ABC transporter permease ThiP [Hahella sp. CCB-MM4]|nr:thiamine/thiamine pyrophosphate ABC transporter permease ThiP [Hahella sp. CCB-MM4]
MASATLLAFYGLLSFSGDSFQWDVLKDPYLLSILRFTLLQSCLSALLSVLLAWPVALALLHLPDSRQKLWFLSLCVLCFVLPTLVLITGIVALLGQSGVLTPLMGEQWNIYGLSGILLAHVYLNMPFAARSIYLRLAAIPAGNWRLLQQLKLSRWQQFRYLEWPAARSATWITLGFVMVLCFNSFAVVLALGGGPKSTTFEVAIYQALKYDFNIPEALVLSWIQLIVAGGLYLVVSACGQVSWLGQEIKSRLYLPKPDRKNSIFYRATYGLAWLFLLAPLLALIPKTQGVWSNGAYWLKLIPPLATSLLLALMSTLLSVTMAYAVLQPYRRALRTRSNAAIWLDGLASHTLVVPAMVLSVGLFVFCLPRIDIDYWGFTLVFLVNALVSVPYALTQLKPALASYDQQYWPIIQTLKLGFRQRAYAEWKFIRPVLLTAASFVSVLVMGDVAIYSIFGNQDFVTLPWLIYGYASTYRIAEAAVASLLLLGISIILVLTLERQRARYA